jgi:hypothetical protein
MSSDEKAVDMDVGVQQGSGKRRARKSRRATKEKDQDFKYSPEPHHKSPEPPEPHHGSPEPIKPTKPPEVRMKSQSPIKPAKVIIAPPKKRPSKLVLVPKTVKISISSKKKAIAKTFKAKRVRLTIDNSSKTRKRRTTISSSVDSLTDDQVRAAAVKAKLSNRESVNKAPIALLKQMIKDYQIMKGMLL